MLGDSGTGWLSRQIYPGRADSVIYQLHESYSSALNFSPIFLQNTKFSSSVQNNPAHIQYIVSIIQKRQVKTSVTDVVRTFFWAINILLLHGIVEVKARQLA